MITVWNEWGKLKLLVLEEVVGGWREGYGGRYRRGRRWVIEVIEGDDES